MTSIIIKDNFKTCKAVLEVQIHGLTVGEYPCVREKGHKGLHQHVGGASYPGGTWATADKLKSIIDNEARSL